MKPQHDFVAISLAAQHCPELIARQSGQKDIMTALATKSARLEKLLSDKLAHCAGRLPISITVSSPVLLDEPSLEKRIGRIAANSLLAPEEGDAQDGGAVLLSLGAALVLGMLDIAFGGTGAVEDGQPQQLPPSSGPVVGRFEQAVMSAFGDAFGLPHGLTAIRRHQSYPMLEAFTPDQRLAVWEIGCAVNGHDPRMALIAIPEKQLKPLLFGQDPGREIARRKSRTVHDAPYRDLPIPCCARLVDMSVPLHRIRGLQPGHILPISVMREVPLLISEKPVAFGTPGEQDDRLALRIARQAFASAAQVPPQPLQESAA
ncbi:MAG: FliM/FliN family flagellar motor C-terminal domain-containing protein [Sphingomonadaceae bacterium]